MFPIFVSAGTACTHPGKPLRCSPTKKGYLAATLLHISFKQTQDCLTIYSLSHHQLLFNILFIVYGTNMEIVFSKSKQNDIFG